MNVLMLCPNLPHPSWGSPARSYYLLKALATKHSVSLLALNTSKDMEIDATLTLLKELVPTVHLILRPTPYSKRVKQLMDMMSGKSYILNTYYVLKMQELLDTLLSREHYDVILLESVLVACYRLPQGVKIVLNQHNLEHELLQRTYQQEKAWLRKGYNYLESRLLKPIEIERCRKADVVLVTSERERLSLQEMLPANLIEVVSNGVEIEAFNGDRAEQEVVGQIIFTGTMDYYPNIDAVLFFAGECWPLIKKQVPTATWQIVGRNPPPKVRRLAELPGITVTGAVPDVRPYLAASSVAIAPLRIGSGTRLKILEALAMNKAVVSTSVGCEGLTTIAGKHLMVADRPETFAQAVVTLLNNPEMRGTFGRAGRLLVEAEYDWEKCGTQLLRILDEVSKKEGDTVANIAAI